MLPVQTKRTRTADKRQDPAVEEAPLSGTPLARYPAKAAYIGLLPDIACLQEAMSGVPMDNMPRKCSAMRLAASSSTSNGTRCRLPSIATT